VIGACVLVSLAALVLLGVDLAASRSGATATVRARLISDAVWTLIPAGFPLLAAVILQRQPRNVIGWLLLVPALAVEAGVVVNLYLSQFPAAPPAPALPLYLLIWFSAWAWLPLMLPLLLLPLFFPTGRPLSPRWGWVATGLLVLALYFILLVTFSTQLAPMTADDVRWSVPNPVGLLTEEQVSVLIIPVLVSGAVLILLSLASLFVRYRRAGAVVRTQIRWLLYAFALFVFVYFAESFLPVDTASGERTSFGYVYDLLLVMIILTIPTAIAIAIVRYRLWDIDVIIRRTLVYSLLTGVLALAYFGSVLLLQNASVLVTGRQQDSFVVVVSTLAIAALFVPVRQRVQAAIDRRFYRRKYDAARTLAGFAVAARDEVDLDRLRSELIDVIDHTMQPESVGLWLRRPR
jgi:hypothetical protein